MFARLSKILVIIWFIQGSCWAWDGYGKIGTEQYAKHAHDPP